MINYGNNNNTFLNKNFIENNMYKKYIYLNI